MFSKVFRADKKCGSNSGSGGSGERRWSGSEQGPSYYPLVHPSLTQTKRVTVHDTGAAESLEHELDLLELVCRSDSLHKRLDQLQAKYERMDDGLQTLSRETQAPPTTSRTTPTPSKRLSIFSSSRSSKSFEEGETKKPNFFQRLFGNRLSKSEDDLLDNGSSQSPSATHDDDDDVSDSDSLSTPPMKERRSASEDVLSWRFLARRGREKRQSWSAESSTPELMPPPSLLSNSQKSGLKRKRVIRVYNLNPLDHKDTRMGSNESCSDSTDSEKEFRSRYGSIILRSASSGRDGEPRVTSPYPHLRSVSGCKMESSLTRGHPQQVVEEDTLKNEEFSTFAIHNSETLKGAVNRVDSTAEAALKIHGDADPQDVTQRQGKTVTDGAFIDERCETTTRKWRKRSVGQSPQGSPAKQNTSSIAEDTMKPTLKTADRSSKAEMIDIYKVGPPLSRTPSSKEVLLTRTPSVQRHRIPSSQDLSKTTSSQELSKTTSSQELSSSKALNHQELAKASSSQEIGVCKAASSQELGVCKTLSSQELPTRLPTTASIQELDHFLSAIIKNLESQLESGGSIALRPKEPVPDATKRRRKKRKEDEQKMEVIEANARRCKRMSECGACGRGWVEPRLLPCLHTICTPCLHARATQVSPTPTLTPTHHANNGRTTTTSTAGSRRASQGQTLPTAPTTTTSPITTTPTHPTPTPSTPTTPTHPTPTTPTHPTTTTPTYPTPTTPTSTTPTATTPPTTTPTTTPSLSYNGGQLTCHWNGGNSSSIRLSLSSGGDSSSSSTSTLSVTTDPQHNTPYSQHLTNNLNGKFNLIVLIYATPPNYKCPHPSFRVIAQGVWVVWCPECGYEAAVPPGGVECFPLNYVLQKQLVLEALNSSFTTVYCDLCHDDVVAEERCDTCPVNLCRLCSHAHTRQRRTTHHTVISLQEARSLGIREVAHTLVCATHGEGEVGWWCRGCHEPLCAACLATLHRGHPTVTVDQAAPQARKKLTALLDQASSRMNYLLSTVEDLSGAATRVQQRGRVVSDQVNAFIDDYIMALEEHRHTLLRQVRQACERAQRGIVTESQRAGQTASWLRQGCDLTHDLLHHAGDAEALALAPLVTCRLQTLLSEQVRGWMRWERLALLREHRAGKVRGHRIQGVIADTPADPSNSRLKPLCDVTNLTVGSKASALVVARDIDGQPVTHGGEEISASILAIDGTTLCGCSVRDREDGSYEVIFCPPLPTAATLHITIQGVHVQGSPLEIGITSMPMGVSGVTAGDGNREASLGGRRHTGVFHCCTFCSSGGDKTATCACGATMPGGYLGCGHNHTGHPGQKHWSCCAQTNPSGPCTRPPSQYYQVTL
ncbi:uncharacterized protein [Cherax quadricarinatus]